MNESESGMKSYICTADSNQRMREIVTVLEKQV